jgi:hypothetical protein
MDKFATGQSVADKLNTTELSIDEAMLGAAQMMQAIVEARREFDMPPAKAQVALTRTAEAVAALTEARRAASAAHAALDGIWREIDRTTGVGGDCPFTCPGGSNASLEVEAPAKPLRIAG